MTGSNIIDQIVPLPPLNPDLLRERREISTDSGTSFRSALENELGPSIDAEERDSIFSLDGRQTAQPAYRSQTQTADETLMPYRRLQPMRDIPEDMDPELLAATRQFEGFFLSLLLHNLGTQMTSGDLFSGSFQSSIYRDMFYRELAKSIGENGSGLGIAEVIYRDIILKASDSQPLIQPA